MASALEQFVNNVRQLSAQGQMTQLCELINKSGELLAKNLSHLDTVLGALDIQEHSLGVLAVLYATDTCESSLNKPLTLHSIHQLFSMWQCKRNARTLFLFCDCNGICNIDSYWCNSEG
uniref:COP9 signalosome complex subunit 3 N-terminal helical repeats domain-containing protein n=1 Tax=Mola mola TaxID=94237 RepID=A0A3Q3W349_MOLML